jgi:all-trans-retinol 13,14-reductase
MGKYDCVIIGSGLGGLVCGAILSGEGLSVCVVEKNRRIGGCLQNFSRKGVVFDTGVHYIGSLNEGQPLDRMFRFLGLRDAVPLKRLNPDRFDVITFDGDNREYRYAAGYDRYVDALSSDFPSERANIRRYADAIRAINDSFPLNSLAMPKGGIVDGSIFTTSTIEFLRSFTSHEKLLAVLAGTNLLYAGISHRTPVYVHACVIHSYIMSAYTIVGGSECIADFLAGRIRGNGGIVMTGCGARSIIRNDRGDAETVELENSERIECAHVISAVHPSLTVSMLDPARLRKSYVARLSGLENTISVFGLYAVMKNGALPPMDHNHYRFRTGNVWTAESYDHDVWPANYFLSSTPQCEGEKDARALTFLSYMKYDEVKRWMDTTIDNRGEEYAVFKNDRAERMIDFIAKDIPGFRDKMEGWYASTPLTYRDYTGTVNGSMYGIFHDATDFINTHITHRTKVPNLFLAGQNVSLHGVMGVMISSLMTCGEFVGLEYLLGKINGSEKMYGS